MANKKAEILTMDGQVVSPITLATNVLLEDGRTAQDLLDSRDESMFSPTITTSSSISKVGQGDNVDFSENIIDGAYKSCVLKGKTLVNHNAEGNNRNEYACMPSLEGSNLTVNGTVEGKVKSAILTGQTLVNLSPFTNKIALSPSNISETKKVLQTLNKNTKYILIFNINNSTSSLASNYIMVRGYNADGAFKEYGRTIKNFGNGRHYILLESTEGNVERIFIGSDFSCEIDDTILTIYQDGMENWDIPYFTGMQSVKMPVLKTTGKNLFDGEGLYAAVQAGQATGGLELLINGLKIKKNTKYSISFKYETDTDRPVSSYCVLSKINQSLDNHNELYVFNQNNSSNGNSLNTRSLQFNSGDFEYLYLSASSITPTTDGYISYSDIQVEEGSTATPFEPYKSNILTVNEEVELGSVGEVKDELNLLTGQLTQRTETRAYQEGDESNSEVLTDMTNTRYKLPKEAIKTVDLSDNVVRSYKDTTHYACSSEGGSLIPTLTIEEGVKYKAIIKPSTKYSIVFNHTEVASGLTVDLGGATTSVTSSTLGKNIVQITTTSTLSHNYVIFKGLGNVIKDVQVIEGEVVGDEPYFEGMCDVEMPVVKNVGKNLFDGGISNHYWNAPFTNGAQDISMQRADNCASTSRIRVRKGETYHLSGVNLIRNVATFFKTKDSQEKPFHGLSANSFTSPYDGYIEWYISNDNINNPVKNVQIEAGSTTTPYEDYKSNILHTPEEVVLRSLPNGAKDTLNLNTGEYVQRIKEVTFDGSNDEGWVVASQTNSTTQCFDVLVAGASSNNDGYIATFCDKFPSYTASHLWYYEKEGVGNPSSRIRLRLNATRLSTVDVAGLRTYLQSNPITVQYELATPIITTIDLKQHLFAYKDGYVVLTSSSEEISLTPTIEYSLIANRLGQIQSNQKLVEKQQAQINELESIVITNLVNTQYQQALNEIKLGVK